ncbi:hypothetical protein M0L20_01095 [Spirosoma sp. RP8]|uniref:Uncharacterized protein n=1 Tax=Spirosoma liriopis TaxID=2937440 RepID=A0ABT0HE26_9BACT|nr:hypothetical protein [Spirosoma liriopis]MCK8490424.1 hypothetical protein [Spirosoma liriopis]
MMKYNVSQRNWPVGSPFGVKRIVVAYQEGVDMVYARHRYAIEQGFRLLAERPDGAIALYWDESGRLARLALEPLE